MTEALALSLALLIATQSVSIIYLLRELSHYKASHAALRDYATNGFAGFAQHGDRLATEVDAIKTILKLDIKWEEQHGDHVPFTYEQPWATPKRPEA